MGLTEIVGDELLGKKSPYKISSISQSTLIINVPSEVMELLNNPTQVEIYHNGGKILVINAEGEFDLGERVCGAKVSKYAVGRGGRLLLPTPRGEKLGLGEGNFVCWLPYQNSVVQLAKVRLFVEELKQQPL